MHCAHLANTLPKGEESAHSHRLSNKPFLICLLTTPPHLKYVATLPCNLSLMACFANLNVVCSDMCKVRWDFFHIRLTANLPWNLPGKKFLNRLKFEGIMVTSLWPRFLAHPADGCYCVILHSSAESDRYPQCHLANDSKASDALIWNLYNESATLPQKWVKGDLRTFHQNVGRLYLFRKNISLFKCCAVW